MKIRGYRKLIMCGFSILMLLLGGKLVPSASYPAFSSAVVMITGFFFGANAYVNVKSVKNKK